MPKLSYWGSIMGVLLEVAVEGNTGRLWGGVNDVAMGAGWCIGGTWGGWWAVAKNAKSSHWGSILGAPLEVAADGDTGRSCGGAYDAVTGQGGAFAKHEASGWGLD